MEVRKSFVTLEPLSRVLTYAIPRLQRGLDETHIQNMICDQKHEYNINKCFSMLQSMTVGVLGDDSYLLDGQHRVKAFQELDKSGYPIQDVVIPIVTYIASTKEELTEYYNRINKHMPIHPFEIDGAWEDYGNVFCRMFTENFGTYISKNSSCRCPHISLDQLKTQLHGRRINIKLENKNKSILDFWNIILDINGYMTRKYKDQLCPKMKNRLAECKEKAVKHKCKECYLGAWRHFEWLDIALYLLENDNTISKTDIPISEFTVVRTKIPVSIRESVWKKHNRNTCDDGECFVCEKDLKYQDMECGHIVAFALGGTNTVENLMPVCKACNRDMGIMNLMEYKIMCTDISK